jgi:hypothetical protein
MTGENRENPVPVPLFTPQISQGLSVKHWWNDNDRGKPRKPCPSATLHTTNITGIECEALVE